MLVISENDFITVGENTVIFVQGRQRLCINAPRTVRIMRGRHVVEHLMSMGYERIAQDKWEYCGIRTCTTSEALLECREREGGDHHD